MGNFKYLVKKLINFLGFEVHRIGSNKQDRTIEEILSHVSRLGFSPKTVIDVGVAKGTFALYETFPNAYHLLIEPLEEFEIDLRAILDKYKGTYVIAAAHSKSGQIELNIHTDHLEGSSILKETMGISVNGIPRIVKTVKIDDLLKDKNLNGPYLVKIDVQGAEIDVLEGATEALIETEVVILEVSMFQFMKSAPQFYDVVVYMNNHEFCTYDFFGGTPRPLDGALGQINVAFVKENGIFRNDHAYATVKQWEKIVKGIREKNRARNNG